uniref:MARVEL domain-containing protein n=1 Tax=Mantoniella antarctica TaxID=81844 RepID=A0A7S0SJ48_9CHLO|mmetsp:Transcript_23147/g.37140  ORF Transcript_23147/g.37140 Transcript_23147/m.37140 type:complete len:204 (-) Transcript_23147:411-1022(-)|eukprot:CAMPEP_0181371472 /NCGR_PEP_ID=MMETSP1106-20121128/14107_1 /TAXON_ID=81844 /ORGANISM="Mantoniella antarctica, Strain SL-175" /LENGTH=203 /DNA_ID=CAMNT_0023488593 /DNA_START=18 /DNA_END=629 /DNA_ORIENTATION=+
MFTAADIDPTATNSPKFRLIAVQCLFALTAFSAMASQHQSLAGPDAQTLELCGPTGCGYSKFPSFKFLVSLFVIYWLFTLFAMAAYLLQKVPPPVTEFLCYTVFNVLLFAAFMASATECNTTIVDPVYPVCKRATAAKASVAFAFMTWLGVCVSMIFTFKEWRDHNYSGIPGSANFDFVPGVTSNPGASYPPQAAAATTQTYA